jgi:LacI family transcriptional regulator
MNLRDVARQAKLSTAAVSLALNDSPKVSRATKTRVRRLARRLGYHADARVVALMRHLRKPHELRQSACFGVISFYDSPRPWEQSLHLTRLHEGMIRRASELGYRLEPLWLKEPGMTSRRFRGILEARGIEGLLCFGSPEFGQEFPTEIDHFAVVTQGLSISTPLHRIINHAYRDTVESLVKLHQRGYRRPGLVLGQYEDLRSAHAHSAAYLGWCERIAGRGCDLPILRMNDVEPALFLKWQRRHRPDAIILVHVPSALREFSAALHRVGRRVPEDLGVGLICPVIEGSGFSGMQEDQLTMGERAVELLVARIANRDLGIPSSPRIEMVEGQWVEGNSLRKASSSTAHRSSSGPTTGRSLSQRSSSAGWPKAKSRRSTSNPVAHGKTGLSNRSTGASEMNVSTVSNSGR